MGDLKDAEKCFQKALMKEGKQGDDTIATEAIAGLAKINIRKKDYKTAESLIEKARKRDPDNPEVNLCRSDLEYARGNYKKSMEILRKMDLNNKDIESYERRRAQKKLEKEKGATIEEEGEYKEDNSSINTKKRLK